MTKEHQDLLVQLMRTVEYEVKKVRDRKDISDERFHEMRKLFVDLQNLHSEINTCIDWIQEETKGI